MTCDYLRMMRIDMKRLTHLLFVCPAVLLLFVLGCQSEGSGDQRLGQLELEPLAPGLSEMYGHQPEHGALLLYTVEDHAAWVVFDDKETCLLLAMRAMSSSSSRPVAELGRADLTAAIGCDPADDFKQDGIVSTSTNPQYTIISFVLPIDYWGETWSLNRAESFGSFETILTPQSVHLIGTREAAARWLKTPLEIDVSCDCGNLVMQALVVR